MEVILLERVDNLGGIGDKVKVKPGYGRNFLIPQGKATLATEANLAVFEERRAELEAKAESELTAAKERAAAVEALELTIPTKVGAGASSSGRSAPMTSPRPPPRPACRSSAAKYVWPKARFASSASTRWTSTCTPT